MEEKDSKENNSDKIQSLREMIYAAEKTLQGAKSMLLQLEGKKKVGRKRKISSEDEDGKIVEGTFDGQIMIGTDGKQYPVPANYASKSKLVEGDVLKLTITPDGSFIYKQIGPTERKRIIGTVNQDGEGNFFVLAENKPFRVLLASITYLK
jgi:DNA/RNA endonuclease YhcR with UshA esterase domain